MRDKSILYDEKEIEEIRKDMENSPTLKLIIETLDLILEESAGPRMTGRMGDSHRYSDKLKYILNKKR